MNAIFPYLILVNLGIIVLYGFFRLFFQQDTFFRFKRIMLMTIFLSSLVFPFMDFSEMLRRNEPVSRVLADNIPVIALPEVVITPDQGNSLESLIFNSLIILYFAVVFFLLCRMLLQIISIMVKVYRSEKSELFGIPVYISGQTTIPFSFFRWIVLDPGSKDEKELYEIVLHEETHSKQYHSIDVICSELMCAFCWFNPFVWLMKREVRMNLEFLADRSVVASGCDTEHYQFHLLRLSYSKTAVTLSNNFNVSPLKKRITMMNKKKTSRLGFAKYALFLPLAALLLIVSNAQALSRVTKEMKEVTGVSISQLEDHSQPAVNQNDSVYNQAEVMPQYPGGIDELMKFLAMNIKYPVVAQEHGVQGMVVVRFVVEKDGQVDQIKVLRSLDPECDAEAIRVVQLMPKWTPGKQNNKKVACYYTLPISYKLTGYEEKKPQPQADTIAQPDPSVVVVGYGAPAK